MLGKGIDNNLSNKGIAGNHSISNIQCKLKVLFEVVKFDKNLPLFYSYDV